MTEHSQWAFLAKKMKNLDSLYAFLDYAGDYLAERGFKIFVNIEKPAEPEENTISSLL